MLEAVQPYAIACGRQLVSWSIACLPSVRSISIIRSGEVPAGISMRAKWTLTPSGTTRGYHASTTLLTLGTMTPSRISAAITAPSQGSLVEPDVFHAPAVVDAVDHDGQVLDLRVPADA